MALLECNNCYKCDNAECESIVSIDETSTCQECGNTFCPNCFDEDDSDSKCPFCNK